ncbi:hypothetical protein ACLMMR_42700, partial [Streptomyces sp. NPDC000405]
GASAAPSTAGGHADGELEDKRISWFHKYVVEKITEHPRLAEPEESKDITTTYTYATFGDAVDGALWAKNQGEFTRPKKRTWDDWRGYPVVTAVTSATDETKGTTGSKSVTRYFRGMADDVLADDTPEKSSDDVKRGSTMTDVTGAVLATDRKAYAGLVAESLTYPDDRAATASGWISRSVNIPDAPVRLATRKRTDGPDVTAERVTLGETRTITKASGKGADGSTLRTVTTRTEYDDTYGLPTLVRELGDEADPQDNTCTATSYVHNTSGTNYLVGLVAQTVTTTGTSTCSTDLSSATAKTMVSGSRMFYDGASSHTATPTKGLVTRTVAPTGAGTGWQTTHPESRTEYDTTGRVLNRCGRWRTGPSPTQGS